jgi:HEAT repeat protein
MAVESNERKLHPEHTEARASAEGGEDPPLDPMTGLRGETEPAPSPAPDAVKSTAPPWWLVAFTLLIPLSVGVIWYMNWMGRPLSAGTIIEYLSSNNDKDVAHALVQVATQVQDAAEEREGARLALDRNLSLAEKDLAQRHSGEELTARLKQVRADHAASMTRIDEQFERRYSDIEQTFEAVLGFVSQAGSRKPNLVEAACGALAAMHHSTQYAPRAKAELRKLLTHDSLVVRRAAACNLGAYGDRSGRDIVLEMLEDPDAAARGNACLALSRGIGLRTDSQRVKKLADSDPNPSVREFAWRAYGILEGQVD